LFAATAAAAAAAAVEECPDKKISFQAISLPARNLQDM